MTAPGAPEEPTGEPAATFVAATTEEVNAQRIANTVVRLTELTVTTDVITGVHFENCEIVGPAVVVPKETAFINCRFDTGTQGSKSLFWELEADRTYAAGGILLYRCHFRECAFRRIGLAGPRDLIQEFERGKMTGPPGAQ